MVNQRPRGCQHSECHDRFVKNGISGVQSDSDSSKDDSNFDRNAEDEEIDEDEAFSKEDQAKFGAWFGEDSDEDGAQAEGASDAIDFEEGLSSDDPDDGDAEEWLQEDVSDDAHEKGEVSEDISDGGEGRDSAHAAMLNNILSHRKGSKPRPEVVTEMVAEGEFNAGGADDGTPPLTVQDLLDSTSLSKADRKGLAKLAAGTSELAAPLPKQIKNRQDRKAAYEVSKKDVSRWTPLVKTNREAATLWLKQDSEVARATSAAGLASRHEAMSSFEKEVASLLKEAGHASTASVQQAEEEMMPAMTEEELQKRRDVLARNHALLFYQEQKAKRLKKIKSKVYRRHVKKQSAKLKATMGVIELDDPDAIHAQAEEAEFKRAQERLTLKHRNTSRWARRTVKRGIHLATDEQQEALHEQLRLSRELRVKSSTMEGSEHSESSSDGDFEAEGDANGDTGAKLSSREKLVLMEAIRVNSATELEASLPKKGLFALPFMRRAVKKQTADIAQEAQEILGADGMDDDHHCQQKDDELAPARQVFGYQAVSAARLESQDVSSSSEDEGVGPASSEDEQDKLPVVNHRNGVQSTKPAVKSGRISSARTRSGKASLSCQADNLQGEATAASRLNPVDTKSGGRDAWKAHAAQVAMAGQDSGAEVHAVLPTSTNQVASSKPASQPMQDELRAAANRPQESQRSAEHAQAAPEVEEENNAQDVGVSSKEALLAAFAGDDVAAEFEKDKAEVIQEAVAAVEEPTALPGWGVWAGSKREPRWLTEKKAKARAERMKLVAARGDAKLKGVIISEKWDKKWQKYTTPSVPFPYKTPEVYEQCMRASIGRDTNTEAAFREMTRPEVIKQTGQIIEPLQLSTSAVNIAAEKRKKHEDIMVIQGGKLKRNKKN